MSLDLSSLTAEQVHDIACQLEQMFVFGPWERGVMKLTANEAKAAGQKRRVRFTRRARIRHLVISVYRNLAHRRSMWAFRVHGDDWNSWKGPLDADRGYETAESAMAAADEVLLAGGAVICGDRKQSSNGREVR